MSGYQLDILAAIDRATTRRDLGIERSGGKAERTAPGWQGRALAHLAEYIQTQHGAEFLTEDFVRAAGARGLEAPPDARAYGSVMRAARLRGLIVKTGYRLALSSNMSPKCLWKG
jgi:hypothetical protein